MNGTPRRTVAVAGRPAGWLEAGAGPVLLLLHGAGGAADLWGPQLVDLADAARVVAPDLPGHGPLAGRGCQRVAAYAEWVEDFVEAAGLGPAVLGGHSMGGAIALTVALGRPAWLTGLVLVATGGRLRVLPRLLELLRDRPAEGRGLVQALAYGPTAPAEATAVADRVLRDTAPLVTLGDYVACDRFDVLDRLGAVAVPTLVVAGSVDRLTPPRYAQALAEGIAGAELAVVDGAGHFPQLERPAAVNASLRRFLAARSRPAGGDPGGTAPRITARAGPDAAGPDALSRRRGGEA